MPDVVIVGAGIIGSVSAWYLRQAGLDVVVVEAARIGAEASSAAAGMLAPQLEAETKDPVFDLGLSSRKQYSAFVAALEEQTGVRVDYRTDGGVLLCASEVDLAHRWEALRWQREDGLRVEHLDASRLSSLCPGLNPRFVGGLFFPDEAHVDPSRLMQALAQVLARSGVKVEEQANVQNIARADSGEASAGADVPTINDRRRRWVVQVLDLLHNHARSLWADHVVIAAGAWSKTIAAPVSGCPLTPNSPSPRGEIRSVHPVRGQMLSLDARTKDGHAFMVGRPFLWTGRGYLVPRSDGSIVVGATSELVGYDRSPTALGIRQLLDAAIDAFPQLGAASLQRVWAGLRPGTSDDRPLIYETDGLIYATGHYRNGILQAPITAEIVRSFVLGREPNADISLFGPLRENAADREKGTSEGTK